MTGAAWHKLVLSSASPYLPKRTLAAAQNVGIYGLKADLSCALHRWPL